MQYRNLGYSHAGAHIPRVLGFMSAFEKYVGRRPTRSSTRVTCHASTIVASFAGFASLIVSRRSNRRNTLRWFQGFCVAEFYFRSPDSARNMDPIVVGCPFQWFPWIDGSTHFFLFLPIIIGNLLGIFTLDAVFLAFLLCFLFM